MLEELIKCLLLGDGGWEGNMMVGRRGLDFSVGTFYIILSFEAC